MMEEPAAVVVATYNSALFVVETLESIKAQTYRNIELIVSDDCSTDNTIAVIRQWLSDENNRGRFIRTELITVPKNTGVSANCNRANNAVSVRWIKHIAGDDILFPNCIEDNMRFISEHPEVKVLFSRIRNYLNDFGEKSYLKTIPEEYPMNIMNPAFTAEDQFKLLLISDRINFTPSYFFCKEAIDQVGGYDEQNIYVEDYPMWLKLTKAGFRLYFMEKVTVGYRQHQHALNNIGNQVLFKPMFLKMYGFRKQKVHPYLPWDIVGLEKQVVWVSKIFQALGWNKKKPFPVRLYRLLTVYANPFQYVFSFKKHVLKMKEHNIFYTH